MDKFTRSTAVTLGVGAAIKAVSAAPAVSGLERTLTRIEAGERLPFRHDGIVFENREGLLPPKQWGYYHEYVHPTPGVKGPGVQRVVTGQGGEIYYTPNHYESFTTIKGD